MEVEKSLRIESRNPSLVEEHFGVMAVHYSLAAKVMAFGHLEKVEYLYIFPGHVYIENLSR